MSAYAELPSLFPIVRVVLLYSRRVSRYLPDQNLIFDTATQLVYANIGTLQPRPSLSATRARRSAQDHQKARGIASWGTTSPPLLKTQRRPRSLMLKFYSTHCAAAAAAAAVPPFA